MLKIDQHYIFYNKTDIHPIKCINDFGDSGCNVAVHNYGWKPLYRTIFSWIIPKYTIVEISKEVFDICTMGDLLC